MSNCPFCDLGPRPASRRYGWPKRALRRMWLGVEWLFPTTLLVLMPKCPMCVAAYVALFTGVGISLPTATWIRTILLVGAWTALAYLAFKYSRVLIKSRKSPAT